MLSKTIERGLAVLRNRLYGMKNSALFLLAAFCCQGAEV